MSSDVTRRSTGRSTIAASTRIKVINLSIGAPVMQPYRDDPLCEAVERAVKAGMTVVVARGTSDGRAKASRCTARYDAGQQSLRADGRVRSTRTARRSGRTDTLAP